MLLLDDGEHDALIDALSRGGAGALTSSHVGECGGVELVRRAVVLRLSVELRLKALIAVMGLWRWGGGCI